MENKSSIEKMRERVNGMDVKGMENIWKFADGLPDKYLLAACEIRSAILETLEARFGENFLKKGFG